MSLRICAGSPEPLLRADAICSEISCTGTIVRGSNVKINGTIFKPFAIGMSRTCTLRSDCTVLFALFLSTLCKHNNHPCYRINFPVGASLCS